MIFLIVNRISNIVSLNTPAVFVLFIIINLNIALISFLYTSFMTLRHYPSM